MMPSKLNLEHYRSILCLNGELPGPLFFTDQNLPVIAADGAANQLYLYGILPHIIIGDLDSVLPEIRKQCNTLFQSNQNSSDFQKCLTYLEKNHLLPSIIVGINGGCLDHVLNNINIFLETGNLLYAPPMKGFVLKAGQMERLELPLNCKLSILGIPMARLSTKGLRWELNEAELSFPGQNSCLNRSSAPVVDIAVQEGKALVLIYEEACEDAGSCV